MKMFLFPNIVVSYFYPYLHISNFTQKIQINCFSRLNTKTHIPFIKSSTTLDRKRTHPRFVTNKAGNRTF